MGKIIETKIDRFDGGMVNDLRSKNYSQFAASKNFDTLSFPHRLVPYRSYEAGNDTVARKISLFVYANSKLYGFGNPSSIATAYYKDTFTDGTWSTTANNAASAALATDGFCVYYAKTGLIYVPTGSGNVDGYDPTGSAAWAVHSLGLNDKGTRAIVHSKDDILYVSYYHSTAGARLGKYDGTTWTDIALTIGPRWVITSLCEYGNYLAIGCKPVSTANLGDVSRVFLWDRDSSVTTLAESIDWGLGDLQILEELEGRLIGISLVKRETSGGVVFNSIISFKEYAGAAGAIEFKRIDGQRSSGSPLTVLGLQKQKVNGRIYFPAILTTEEGSGSKEGIWSIGRSGQDRPLSVQVEHQTSDGTVPTAIDGFFILGSYVFIAYSNTGSFSGNISKTDDSITFSNSSTYESLVFDGGDPSLTKKLIGVTVFTTPMPIAGQVVMKYAVDSSISLTTTFTTIFTDGTDNSISHSAVNIESTGATLPEFKEIQFQIVSTGGATVTGFSFAYEIVGKRLY